MPRKPKGRQQEKAETIKCWFRESVNFDEIEKALRAEMNQDDRADLESSMAFAVEGERRRLFGTSPEDIRKFLSRIAECASSLADQIAPSPERGHGQAFQRFLLPAIVRDGNKLDLPAIAENLRGMARAAQAEVKRQPRRLKRAGPPRKNDDWNLLIQDLADVFERIHDKQPGISFSTGEATGKFYCFARAVFAEIPKSIRPTNTALGPLIKEALKLRKAQKHPVES